MVATDEHSHHNGTTTPSRNSRSTESAQSEKSMDASVTSVANSIGAGGDQYTGLDQFGRIVSQQWANSTGAVVDGYTYTYDQNSNVTSKANVLDSAYSETYTNDNLNRLTAVTRGGAAYQNWNLDSQGNWSSSTTSGTTQIRTANSQNQITSITGTAGTPVYDSNGNMTTDQNGNKLVYDAWNRLVKVTNSSGQIIAQYTYNAMGYRISESYPQGGNGVAAGTVNYIYYNSNWQTIETRTNGTANSNVTSQMVWSAAYINAAILQDTYSAGVIQPNSRIYFLQDANWNTTAIVGYNSTTGAWGVTQRYVYSPHGSLLVLNSDFSTPPGGTQPLVNNLYQGMTLDQVTGLYDARNRNYSPSLGVWISQDPAQYINGANTYQFVMGNPVGATDPSGLAGDETGGGDFGDDPQDNNIPPPPPESIWDVMTELMFGVGPYEGPPVVNAPAGYQWGYPPTISAPGTPFDPTLWQLGPTNPNDPKTPWVNMQGPNGNTLTPEEQIAAVKKAIAANSGEQSSKPPAKVGPQCPGAAKTPMEIAEQGGRQSGFLKNYVGRSTEELQKGIQSLDKQIAEHQAKLANPEKAIPNFKSLDARQQQALLKTKWPSDIQRLQEQKQILQGILDKRK